MQKWEYLHVWVWAEQVAERTGETGLFGGEKTQKVIRWFTWLKGDKVHVEDALDKYGEAGWELVAAVPGTAPYAKGSYD